MGGWKPVVREVERFEQGFAPGSLIQIKKQSASGASSIRGKRARKSQADVILGKQYVSDAVKTFGFVVPHPKQLGSRKTRKGIVSTDPDQGVQSHVRSDGFALSRCPLIVPQNSRTNDLFVVIQKNKPVHLPRQTHTYNVRCSHYRIGENLPNCAARGHPPSLWILLTPEWIRRGECMGRAGHGLNLAMLVQQERFTGRRGNVYSEQHDAMRFLGVGSV